MASLPEGCPAGPGAFTEAVRAACKTFPRVSPGHELQPAEPGWEERAAKAARAVMPDWLAEEPLRTEPIAGGLTNALVRVAPPAGPAVLVRGFGDRTDRIIDRERDEAVFGLLSELGIGPTLVGRVAGGRVEGFLDGGRPLEPGELGRPEVVPLIAKEVARLHSVMRDEAAAAGPELLSTLRRWLAEAEAATADDSALASALSTVLGGRGVAGMREEVAWLGEALGLDGAGGGCGGEAAGAAAAAESGAEAAAELARNFALETVLCHNDLLGGNLLLLPGRVQLLDFEYSGPNPRAFEWANHMCERAGFAFDIGSAYPETAEAKKPFLREYMASASPALLAGVDGMPEAEAAAFWAALSAETNRFAVASHAFWGLWSVVQARWSTVDFDFVSYARLRWDKGFAPHKKAFFR